MPIRQRWKSAESATVAADGTAEVRVTLGAAGVYEIFNKVIKLSDRLASAQCVVYIDSVSDSNIIDGAQSAGIAASDTPHEYEGGQQLIAYFTGATPGTTAVLRVEGTFTPAGN